MDERSFCYWLQGFAELHTTPPTPEQWQSIREHLATVFSKVTPPVPVQPRESGPGIGSSNWDEINRTDKDNRFAGRPAFIC